LRAGLNVVVVSERGLAGILVANAVGFKYFVDKDFPIAYFVGFSFLKDAVDYTLC
jgi:hypothetical protein